MKNFNRASRTGARFCFDPKTISRAAAQSRSRRVEDWFQTVRQVAPMDRAEAQVSGTSILELERKISTFISAGRKTR